MGEVSLIERLSYWRTAQSHAPVEHNAVDISSSRHGDLGRAGAVPPTTPSQKKRSTNYTPPPLVLNSVGFIVRSCRMLLASAAAATFQSGTLVGSASFVNRAEWSGIPCSGRLRIGGTPPHVSFVAAVCNSYVYPWAQQRFMRRTLQTGGGCTAASLFFNHWRAFRRYTLVLCSGQEPGGERWIAGPRRVPRGSAVAPPPDGSVVKYFLS